MSIVADADDAEQLLVRARFAGDLERVFPKATVIETPAADYRFRASLPRAMVGEAIARRLATMTATNFQGLGRRTMAARSLLRHLGVMHGEQRLRHPAQPRRPELPLFKRRRHQRRQ